MLFALGAAFSSADFLKSLTARASSTASTGSGQAAGHSFAAADTFSSPDSAAPGFRYSLPGHGLSPDTMNALLAAQGQSSGSDATASSRFAASANDSESGKSDDVPSGSIGVSWSDGKTTTSTTITPIILNVWPTPLDVSVLTHLTGEEVPS